jgi:hypothetical protein
MGVQLAMDDLIGCLDNEVTLRGIQLPEVAVREGAGFFKNPECLDQLAGLGVIPDIKMMKRPGGLGSPVPVVGNFNGSHAVSFETVSGRGRGRRGMSHQGSLNDFKFDY